MSQVRGEPSRLALAIGGIEYEDDRIATEDWSSVKPTTPLGSVPVAVIDGKTAVQSNAILRYFGTITKLYPKDGMEMLQVDEVIDTVGDFFSSLGSAKADTEEDLKAAQEAALKSAAPRYWGGCQKLIEDMSDGPFVLGKDLSIADLSITSIYVILQYGFFKYVPADALDGYKRMREIADKVLEIPEVKQHYKEQPVPGLYPDS